MKVAIVAAAVMSFAPLALASCVPAGLGHIYYDPTYVPFYQEKTVFVEDSGATQPVQPAAPVW